MRSGLRIDWAGKHGTFAGTVNGALSTWALTMVGYLLHIPAIWALGAGIAAAAATLLASVGQNIDSHTLLYRAACWTGAGVWMTWAIGWGNPWSLHAVVSLVIGALVIGIIATALSRGERREQEKQRAALRLSQRARRAHDWEQRIRRVCNVDAQVVGEEEWAGGTGYTLDLVLGGGGATWKSIASFCDGLAADARLPEGCGVEVGPGADRGSALLRISIRNALLEPQPYPEDYSPLTILNPIPMGVLRDGDVAGVELREETLVITGEKGSGKTNQEHVTTAGLVRCVDTLIWTIDFGGGGLPLPWLWAWHEGRAERPAIDWVATTGDEALAMTEVALDIAKRRKVAYQYLKRQTNTNLLPVSPELPEIVIIIDEGAEVTGERTKHRQVAANVEEIVRIARDSAVNVVLSGLRATADVIPPGVLHQARARIGMRVSDSDELNRLFGWRHKLSADDIPFKGGAFILTEQLTPRPMRGFFLDPARIDDIAVAAGGIRPGLDQASLEVAGSRYEKRWERAGHLWTGEPVPVAAVPAPQAAAGDSGDLDDARRQLAREVAAAQGRDPNLAEDFLAIVEPLRGELVDWSDPSRWPSNTPPPEQPGEPEPATPDRRAVMLQIIDAAGQDGITPKDLLDGLHRAGVRIVRQTLHDWLADAIRETEVVRVERGRKAVYVAARFVG